MYTVWLQIYSICNLWSSDDPQSFVIISNQAKGLEQYVHMYSCIMCNSRENPYPPHGRSLEIPRGRGVLKVKILEDKYEAN